ncbi:uncharacterized protein LOC129597242 [Paramacrobiotus metropolitanus]|uniref:uncharacterized protein LOC129597242 n=1 Tax=Paramacrobiotus metropolitanus TaxID=2943436 RepID=UPI0024458B4A|nr:uncharacterized protein LOC129597242 [Paramacrobiotus metropolitanus]
MYLLAKCAAVLLMTGICAARATEKCTLANVRGVAACSFPLALRSFTSDGQELTDVSLVTDTALSSLCQIAREVVTCVKEVSRPCKEGAMAVLHEAMVKGLPLLDRACNRSTFGNTVRTLLGCVKTLNQTEGTKSLACAYKATNLAFTNPAKGEDGDNDIIKSFCCNAKAFMECSGNEIGLYCDQTPQQKLISIRDTLFATFQCNGVRGANCPAWPPGLPRARDLKWDLSSLMTEDKN